MNDRGERRFINPPDVWNSTRYGFSQAVVAAPGEIIFVSGQDAWDVDQRSGTDDLHDQARGAFANLERVLTAAGSSLADITALRIYIVAEPDDDLSAVSAALRATFPADEGPAATWILVRGLARPDFRIEVEATAVRR